MTEDDWQTATFALLLMFEADHIQRDVQKVLHESERLSIAARVACLQRFGPDLPDAAHEWIALAVEFVERPEDRKLPLPLEYAAKRTVHLAIRDAYQSADSVLRQRLAALQDVFHGGDGYHGYEEYLLEADDNSPTYTGPVYASESEAYCEIIRDVFGNPFRPVAFNPAWRTDTAVSLTRTMYDSREFGAMPILADALQDAGCEDEQILNHCRDANQVHVRGCWVCDLVLGKE